MFSARRASDAAEGVDVVRGEIKLDAPTPDVVGTRSEGWSSGSQKKNHRYANPWTVGA